MEVLEGNKNETRKETNGMRDGRKKNEQTQKRHCTHQTPHYNNLSHQNLVQEHIGNQRGPWLGSRSDLFPGKGKAKTQKEL